MCSSGTKRNCPTGHPALPGVMRGNRCTLGRPGHSKCMLMMPASKHAAWTKTPSHVAWMSMATTQQRTTSLHVANRSQGAQPHKHAHPTHFVHHLPYKQPGLSTLPPTSSQMPAQAALGSGGTWQQMFSVSFSTRRYAGSSSNVLCIFVRNKQRVASLGVPSGAALHLLSTVTHAKCRCALHLQRSD